MSSERRFQSQTGKRKSAPGGCRQQQGEKDAPAPREGVADDDAHSGDQPPEPMLRRFGMEQLGSALKFDSAEEPPCFRKHEWSRENGAKNFVHKSRTNDFDFRRRCFDGVFHCSLLIS